MASSDLTFIDSSVKELSESETLHSLPTQFNFVTDRNVSNPVSLPVVDYSLLTTGTPDQRSIVLHDLAMACEEGGFFILVNHGIPEALIKSVTDASLEFFKLPEDDKRKYEPKTASDPIMSGSIIHVDSHKLRLWRDYVKSYVHPQFHCPEKPQILRDTVFEYSKLTRPVARNLLHAISENLGLEEGYMDEMLKLDSCLQLYASNFYPPCPQPDQTIGLPPHTDYGLLTFLIHNGVAGLQIQQNGKWFNVESPQNSILVNTGDHLQIFSNGRYKSSVHRAVVNADLTRISVVMSNGAGPEAIVGPAAQLVDRDGRALYRPMKYIDYIETRQSNRLEGLLIKQDCTKTDQEE